MRRVLRQCGRQRANYVNDIEVKENATLLNPRLTGGGGGLPQFFFKDGAKPSRSTT